MGRARQEAPGEIIDGSPARVALQSVQTQSEATMNGKQERKLRRLVKRAYPGLYNNLMKATYGLPLWHRLKIAMQIVFRWKQTEKKEIGVHVDRRAV